jgi:hypothetical protein
LSELPKTGRSPLFPLTRGVAGSEFRGTFLGASQNCSATHRGNFRSTGVSVPSAIDWRDKDAVSPVK